MKGITLTLIALQFFTLGFAQTADVSKNQRIEYDRGFSSEINYQGKFGFSLGALLGKNMGEKLKSNYSLSLYSDFILADSLIVGPRVKLNWNYLSIFGVGINVSNNYRSGLNDFRITPEVNFSYYGLANFFIGYSFVVSKTKFNELSAFRFGININVVGK